MHDDQSIEMSVTQAAGADESVDDRRYRSLVRSRRLATFVLLLMVLMYALTTWFRHRHPTLLWLRAFSEASIIGALVSWFAVTAPFRRLFWLPIPLTAALPRAKN